MNDWLVVWNMNFMTFHILGITIPTDEVIFFRGVGSTTNQMIYQSVLTYLFYKDHVDGTSPTIGRFS
jgi:hypothetical protein